jgi:hypothetical protein
VWDVEGTDEFSTFYVSLTDNQRDRVDAAVDQLVEHGPNLGRPLVDRIVGSRIHHLKELRPTSSQRSAIRILFAFDPARTAILLLGGDKASDSAWNDWYTTAVPLAEALYDIYLDGTNQKD